MRDRDVRSAGLEIRASCPDTCHAPINTLCNCSLQMSRAMRYHYGNEKQGRKGHLAMVKEKRLVYSFGELAVNWRRSEVASKCAAAGGGGCELHELCRRSLCLWTKE